MKSSKYHLGRFLLLLQRLDQIAGHGGLLSPPTLLGVLLDNKSNPLPLLAWLVLFTIKIISSLRSLQIAAVVDTALAQVEVPAK